MLQDLTCVIPAFNSAAVIGRALASLPADVRAIVVDNASCDDTAAVVAAARQDAQMIVMETNGGFARACNAGFAEAATPYVCFVNPDLAVGEGALEAVVAAADADRRIAVLGSAEAITGNEAGAAVEDAEMVSGAFLTVRRTAFPAGEAFDPAFFMYFEDYDLCVRTRQAGHRVVLVRAARVDHAEGASTAAKFDNALEKSWLWGASCQYFADKHAGTPDGAKAARKLRQYPRKALLYRLAGRRREAALFRARMQGAEDVRRDGPQAMHRNGFVTGHWQTAGVAP